MKEMMGVATTATTCASTSGLVGSRSGQGHGGGGGHVMVITKPSHLHWTLGSLQCYRRLHQGNRGQPWKCKYYQLKLNISSL